MRSVLAVIVGFAAMAVIVIVATIGLAELMYPDAARGSPTPPTTAWLAVNFAYSFAAATLGGWLAARLAPRAPFAHAIALAVLALVMALPGLIGGAQPEQPAWYPTAVAVVALGGILVGGALAARRGASV